MAAVKVSLLVGAPLRVKLLHFSDSQHSMVLLYSKPSREFVVVMLQPVVVFWQPCEFKRSAVTDVNSIFPVKQTLLLVAHSTVPELKQVPKTLMEHLLQVSEFTSMKDAITATIPSTILAILMCWFGPGFQVGEKNPC